MSRVSHLLTLVAMAATAAALAVWVPLWWLGVLVAVVIDGAWWTAAQYERRMKEAGADATAVTALTWVIASLSAGLLAVHALTESSVAWGAVAVLPLVSRTLAWVHALWEDTELTTGALAEIRRHRQTQRDAVAIDRARLRAEAATERARLAEVSTAAETLATERAAALDRMERARELTAGSRALSAVPTGWHMPVLGPSVPVSAPAPAVADSTAPALTAPDTHDREDAHVSAMTAQVTPAGRLDAEAARRAIEEAWTAGLTVREAAVHATRSASYVGTVYAQLAKARGAQPSKGQTRIHDAS